MSFLGTMDVFEDIYAGYEQKLRRMRRLDYDYVDYDRPQDFTAVSKIVGTSKNEPTYWFRRFSQSTHESNYNLTQLKASNKQAMTDPIWSCPVWWDCATDNEYYGYIK